MSGMKTTVVLFASFVSVVAQAVTGNVAWDNAYSWNSTTGGSFFDTSCWRTWGGSDFDEPVAAPPGAAPHCWTNCIGAVAPNCYSYRITFPDDVTLGRAHFSTLSDKIADVTLDFCGHTFTVDGEWYLDGWDRTNSGRPTMSLTMSNGVANITTTTSLINRWSVDRYHANLTFGAGLEARFAGSLNVRSKGRPTEVTAITAKDGAHVNFTKGVDLNYSSSVTFRITGEGTAVTNLSDGAWYINKDCHVIVEDHASFEYSWFRIWGSNTSFEFDNVACTNRNVGEILQVGYTQTTGVPVTNCVVESRNNAKVGFSKGVKLGGPYNKLRVIGGSDVFVNSGGIYLSSEFCDLDVDDSTLVVNSGNALTLGAGGTYVWGRGAAASNCTMRISGRDGHVSTGRFVMYNNSALEFDIPRGGYATTPLEVTTETGIETNTDCHIVINADKFMVAHPGETITLATFKSPRDTTVQTQAFNTRYAITNSTRFVRHGREYRINENPALTGTITYEVVSDRSTLTYTAPVSSGLIIKVE